MAKNMTIDELQRALDLMEQMRPPHPRPEAASPAFEPVSYDIVGGPDFVLLRLVDRSGEIKDLRLTQAVAVSLVGHLAAALHVVDWMDSSGNVLHDPPSR